MSKKIDSIKVIISGAGSAGYGIFKILKKAGCKDIIVIDSKDPEFGVEFTPIDYARFAEACGGKGYSIKEPNDVNSIMHEAMSDKKPAIIEAYVDPFDPPMPPKVEMEFVRKMAESFSKGQPYAQRIGLTLFRNQVHERLKDFHHHQIDHYADYHQ